MSETCDAIRFRKPLTGRTFLQPVLRKGLRFAEFDPSRHARAARFLLNLCYRAGGGEVLSFDEWWDALIEDDEFDLDLCFVIETISSRDVIGFAQCWISGFVKDIAVLPEFRREGIGRALMGRVFYEFSNLGLARVDLRARVDNPSGALSFYRALGMHEVIEDAAA